MLSRSGDAWRWNSGRHLFNGQDDDEVGMVKREVLGQLRELHLRVAVLTVVVVVEEAAVGVVDDAVRCVRGIETNQGRIREHLEQSLMLVTALSPHIGYEKAAEIAHYAHHKDMSLRAAALKLGYVTQAEFEAWVRPEDMTHPIPNG